MFSSQPRSELAISKPRKTTSTIWHDFTKVVIDGVQKAQCKYCPSTFMSRPKDGTSHLRSHMKRKHPSKVTATPNAHPNVHQMLITSTRKSNDAATQELKVFRLDQVDCRQALARMIILHDYPFSIVDHHGFRDFIEKLQPQFKLTSRATLKKDCSTLYEREREKLYSELGLLDSRISITCEMCASNQNKQYFTITAHFVDLEWNICRKVLNFSAIDDPHSENSLSNAILEKLYRWSVDSKVMSIVLENCPSNDMVARELLGKLPSYCLLAEGQLFYVRCSAHIVNLMVNEGIEISKDVTTKIRDSVNWVNSSTLRQETFKELASHVNAPNKNLVLDDPTKWNTTFFMLETALEFKEVFSRLAIVDLTYNCALNADEWDRVSIVCSCLSVFHEVTKMFSESLHSSANYFFSYMCKIHIMLLDFIQSSVPFLNEIGANMMKSFEIYWKQVCIILSVTSVMDPRCKLNMVEFYMIKIYGVDVGYKTVADIKLCLQYLYNDYNMKTSNQNLITSGGSDINDSVDPCHSRRKTHAPSILSATEDEYEKFIDNKSSSKQVKNEIDSYLEDAVVPRQENFDILLWWKMQAAKYPIMTKMAKDLLSIPVSIGTSESVFSMKGRVLDQYKSTMHPNVVEALVCTQDWIKNEYRGCGNMDVNLGSAMLDVDDGIDSNE